VDTDSHVFAGSPSRPLGTDTYLAHYGALPLFVSERVPSHHGLSEGFQFAIGLWTVDMGDPVHGFGEWPFAQPGGFRHGVSVAETGPRPVFRLL